MFENESYFKLLNFQENNIIQWNVFLESCAKKSVEKDIELRNKETELLFQINIKKIKIEIEEIIDLLDLQHKRIENDLILNIENDDEAYMIQDILRERLKHIETSFIDFKYKLMNYFSANY
jgi:hypothetical protein